MQKFALSIALVLAQPVWAEDNSQPHSTEAAKPPKEIARELASGDGKTSGTAYVIRANDEGSGVAKEYAILKFFGLVQGKQSLIMKDGKTYDTIEATDPKTGETRTIWFDISKFFGKLF
ncbi:MAG: hypothetical protein ACKOQ3_05785 [Novosphingobium sp.]